MCTSLMDVYAPLQIMFKAPWDPFVPYGICMLPPYTCARLLSHTRPPQKKPPLMCAILDT
jgi:hypothetical protein